MADEQEPIVVLDDEGNEIWVEGPNGTPVKLAFAPGCFDNFDGTQEELDELVANIKEMFISGEAFANSEPVDFDNMSDEEAEEIAHALGIALSELDDEHEIDDEEMGTIAGALGTVGKRVVH